MPSFLGINLESSGSPSLFWAWGAATLMLATGLGFVAGLLYANRSSDRGLRKAVKTLSSLYSLSLDSVDKAQRLMKLLEGFPQLDLTADQVEQLDERHGSLTQTVSHIVERQRAALVQRMAGRRKTKPQPIELEWQRPSLDPGTGLVDRPAFDVNLQAMLDAGARSASSSGLLLVRIDRVDQLKSRFGILGADAFVKTMAAVISRAVREQDLTCRLSADSFAVLFPSVDADAGRKLSQAVRNSVRVHTFRLNDFGPEVLITASFGYTSCPPRDSAASVLLRAEDALAQSMRRGRNQLHVFEGESVVDCTAG